MTLRVAACLALLGLAACDVEPARLALRVTLPEGRAVGFTHEAIGFLTIGDADPRAPAATWTLGREFEIVGGPAGPASEPSFTVRLLRARGKPRTAPDPNPSYARPPDPNWGWPSPEVER